jgi:hypothetical protein
MTFAAMRATLSEVSGHDESYTGSLDRYTHDLRICPTVPHLNSTSQQAETLFSDMANIQRDNPVDVSNAGAERATRMGQVLHRGLQAGSRRVFRPYFFILSCCIIW